MSGGENYFAWTAGKCVAMMLIVVFVVLLCSALVFLFYEFFSLKIQLLTQKRTLFALMQNNIQFATNFSELSNQYCSVSDCAAMTQLVDNVHRSYLEALKDFNGTYQLILSTVDSLGQSSNHQLSLATFSRFFIF